MPMTIKVKIPKGLKMIDTILSDEVKKAVRDSTLSMEGAAKQFAPVDTGHLRRSIASKTTPLIGGVTGIIGTAVSYAPYVEYGTGIYARNGNGRKTPWVYKNRRGQFVRTRGNKPQPFMRTAYEVRSEDVVNRIHQAVLDAVEKASE